MSKTNISGRRICALDLGTRYIGVAASDPTQSISFPLGRISIGYPSTHYDEGFSENFSTILRKNRIEMDTIAGYVIGYPRKMDGSESHMSTIFTELLRKTVSTRMKNQFPWKNILLMDERLSTVAARSLFNQMSSGRNFSAEKDALAAHILLETYIMQRNNTRMLQ